MTPATPDAPGLPMGLGDSMDVFDLSTAERPLPRDVKGKRVVGASSKDSIPGNFIDCLLDGCSFSHTYFDTTDFTNCVIQNVTFDACQMYQGSITGCAFVDCEFVDTTMELYALHDCLFSNVSWSRLQFRNSLVRHSQVRSCEIIDSFVTNQMFDECIILDCVFRATAIDFRIIIENFGVSQDTMNPTLVRRDRTEKAQPERDELESILENINSNEAGWTKIDKFKIQYYLSNGFHFSGEAHDAIFEKNSWYTVALTPGSLTRALEHFSELILHTYNQGDVEIYAILRLHDLSNKIYQELRGSERYGSIAQTAVGIHVRTGDIINNLENDFQILAGEISNGRLLHFRTRDGVTEAEVIMLASELSDIGVNVNFHQIRRNSPLDLIASPEAQSVILFAAFFCLTRMNFELSEITGKVASRQDQSQQDDQDKGDALGRTNVVQSEIPPLINLAIGIPQDDSQPLFSLTSRGPGQTLVKVSLTVNTSIIRRARRALYHIVTDNGDGSAGA